MDRGGQLAAVHGGRSESDRTELLHFHFSPSCIGEGNGNPLQYSCLENPRDRGAWWAAIYGVAQSQTQLKRLSSTLNSRPLLIIYFIYSNAYVYILLPNIWFIPLPFPFDNQKVFFFFMFVICFVNKFTIIYLFLDYTYKWYHMIFLCLAYFT